MAAMSDAILGQIIVGATALVSGSVGLLAGFLTERWRAHSAREARSEARQDQRDEYQRQTLLESQEAISRFGSVVWTIHGNDIKGDQATGTWSRTRFAGATNEEFISALLRLQMLTARVQDDELRRLVTGYYNRGVLVTTAASKKEAGTRMDDWIERLGEVQDRLGSVLR